MKKPQLTQKYWPRTILRLLVVEVILVALCWVLHRYVGWFQRFYFSDVIFMLGALALTIGGIGSMARSYEGSSDARMKDQTYHIQPTEQERRAQKIESAVRQRAFSLSFVIIGLMNLVLAGILAYI